MRIFVTGGTGFLGSHFLKKAYASSHRAAAIRRPGSQPRIPLDMQPTWLDGDLEKDWTSELAQCRTLVHFAAAGVPPRKAEWPELFDVNVRQSVQLWHRAIAAGVKRLIICGCGSEYGKAGERTDFIKVELAPEPADAYAVSKVAATMAAMSLAVEKKVEVIVLRPFEVYGDGQPETCFWNSLRKAAVAGEDFAMTPGEQIRDFIAGEKVAEAFVNAIVRNDLKPGEPKIENVASGRPQTLRAFAEHYWTIFGAKGRLKVGARPARPDEVKRFIPAVRTDAPMWL
ncbi:MAG TPA: NAD-dependent epimerase/dehydratase family protein [Desulfuromonadaceae bacterium]|nr:NAD-dependent epimerase/dehydratase family protein [Desulfuromonadaceae bacterium]